MGLISTEEECVFQSSELELDLYCLQQSILDAVNLLFLSAFYLLLSIEHVPKHQTVRSHRREWMVVVVALCCAATSMTYFGEGVWEIIKETDNGLSWILHLVRGFIWISFSVSLHVQKSKLTKILVSFWWVMFSLLDSAIKVQTLVANRRIQILDIATWPVSLLLLPSAFRLFSDRFTPNTNDNPLSDPLIFTRAKKKRLNKGCCFSKLTFSWINPLLSLGYSRPLTPKDIPSLAKEDEAEIAYKKFVHIWDSVDREKSPSSNGTKNLVLNAVVKAYLRENIYVAFCALLKTVCAVSLPLLLHAFVEFSNSDEHNLHYGICILGSLVFLKVIESLSTRHWYFGSKRSGMRIRSALMVAVYQKQLKLSNLGRRKHSPGEIVNYIAIDAYRMGEFPWWFHLAWSLMLQLLLSAVVLFTVVGLGALPGLVPLLIGGALNLPFAKMLQNCQTQFMIAQDERLRATSEILKSMKIIKLQSWEEEFKKLIESCRAIEFKWLSKAQLTKAYGTILYWMSPTIVSSVIFAGCILFRSAPLDASTIFTVLATLRIMGDPVKMIPHAISAIVQVKVSFDRINCFLLDEEIRQEERGRANSLAQGKAIEIKAGVFSWDPEVKTPTLKNVDFELRPGQKVAVCGPVGAGKSSLLQAMLGEITRVSGTVETSGTVAYVSQTSWIQSGTVQDNILYGKPMDHEQYRKAVRACALDKDLDSFDHGDLTEIGERGLNLSGGQKQRVQLARAVYNDADIYLLDDPFSAVDAHTAAILFKDCVLSALREKTVVLVTHQVEFLPDVDKILVMEDGQITLSGSYEELLTAGTAFEQLVNAHSNLITICGPTDERRGERPQALDLLKRDEHIDIVENIEEETSAKTSPGIQLTEEEEMGSGVGVWKPILDYIVVSRGSFLACLAILSQFGFVVLQAAATYWLAFAIQIPKITNPVLIGVFTSFSSLSAVFVYLRSFITAHLGLKASKTFFLCFTDAIFRAPMLFFDSTPIGRILTRASSDLSILDFDIPFAFIIVVATATEILATIGIMASVTWQVLIVAVLAMIATKYVQDYYLASARELIRINGTTKAPVMNYAAETSLGVITIRAFNMVNRFYKNFLKLVDTDAVLFFLSNAAMEWVILRIEALQNVTLFSCALLLIVLPKGYVAPGLVGLSLTYAFALSQTQVLLTQWYCSLSNSTISAERIKQYMNVPPGPPAIVEDNRPPSSWPSKGRIELKDLKIKYRPNAPLVLKGITCTFIEGNRIGVVGRTGSGKTTLISALFRLVEPTSGQILIDGLDISMIGLKDLRSKLSIIPQEPTLFKGTVRTNLDPLGLYSDDEIWEALGKCQLKSTISNLPNKLESSVRDEGENWSAGQRQLFCLGRVLLKRNRILVLDEATASIDSATDAVLQRIIRKEFSECTVLTVAHRVPTVIDSDMVLALSFGRIVEYDEPSRLMKSNDSSFSKLVAEYMASNRSSSS